MINRLIQHGILFVFAKSIVLIAPLIAAYFLKKSSYGMFEWSISISMIISTILTVGAGNTIAFEKIKNESSPLIYIGQIYSIYLGLGLACLSIVVILIFNNARIGLIFGMSAFLIIQYALSAYIKANGLGAKASIIDSGIYIVLLGLLFFTWIEESSELLYTIAYALSAITLSALLYKTITKHVKITKVDIKKFFTRGFPIMLSGSMIIVFFSLPKVLLGSNSMALVGEFSLYFRWAAVAIVIYQFLIVVFFRDLYTKSYIEFDKFIAGISLGVYSLGLLVLLLLYLANISNIKYLPLPEFNASLQIVMLAIIALWALTASLEGVLYRENKSIHQMLANLFGILIFLVLFYFFQDTEHILYITIFSWFTSFVTIIFYQLYIIHKFILQNNFVFINSLFLLILTSTIFLLEIIV